MGILGALPRLGAAARYVMNKKCIVCDGDILLSSGWFVKGYRKGWVCSDECWDKYHQDERARAIRISWLGSGLGRGAIGG